MRQGLTAPPDRVPNPVLFIGIGSFGHDVLVRLEDHAAEVAEVHGPDAVRNVASLRILDKPTLVEAWEDGFEGESEIRRGLCFDGGRDDYGDAFGPVGLPYVQGLSPGGNPGAEDLTPYVYLRETLCDLVALLFRVDRFVDYHDDVNRYVSRLDVHVIGDVDDPLSGAVHQAVQGALSELVAGRLAPLFREHRSNLSLTHLAAFPLVRSQDSMEAARRLVADYRDSVIKAIVNI